MDQLTALLSGLGPWGIVAGVALTIGAQVVRARLAARAGTPAVPVAPAPVAVPVPAAPVVVTPVTPVPVAPPVVAPVAPAPSGTPVLDAILSLVRAKLLGSTPAGATDVDHETAGGVLAQIFAPNAPKK